MTLFMRTSLLFVAMMAVLAPRAFGQAVTIDIYGPSQGAMNMALAQPLGAQGTPAPAIAEELRKEIQNNLSYLPFLKLVPPHTIIGGDQLDGYTIDMIDFRRFQLVGADMLLTMGWTGSGAVELRVFQVFTQKQLVGKSYTDVDAAQVTTVADRFCEAFMEALTGYGQFFRSSLAFVKSTGKSRNIFAMTSTGRNLRQVTQLEGYCLSPSWSKDGRYIAFTFIDDRKHSLGVADLKTGKVTTRPYKGSTVISPAFTTGNKVAVSMSDGPNSDIVLLDNALKVERKLVQSGSIDVSPSFDKSGSVMAFVSDRFGGPQIFVSAGGGANRVTFEGSYNTDPSISPEGDKVVFTRRTPSGFRIYLHDLRSGQEQQITFGPGNDEQPDFAPDGYFVAFKSTRDGGNNIYLTTRHGAEPVKLPTGGGSFPAWGLTN